jgi:hypothetical protein
MFEVCIDERSSSRLALVWLPDAPAAQSVSDSRAANLLFTVLGRDAALPAKSVAAKTGPIKIVPGKPARRPRKSVSRQTH